MVPLQPLIRLYSHLQKLVEEKLWIKVLIGLALGVAAGVLLGPAAGLVDASTANGITTWLALPGNLFIGLVQMIMIPLVVASIISGLAGEGNNFQLRRLGVRVGLYFLATTLVAIIIGIAGALIIRPGATVALVTPSIRAAQSTAPPATGNAANVPTIISNLVPSNPLASVLAGEMLSIVIFALIVGVALVSMPREKAQPVLDLLFAVQEICMTVTRWAMRLAPFAVFGLMARIIANVGLDAIMGLSIYVLTVVAALLVLLGVYCIIIVAVGRISLWYFFRSAQDVLLLAFSVASSAAVMPLTMKTAEQKFNVPPSVARFIVPIGAIVNMNGTAAYQAIATLFLAQAYGMELGLMAIILVVVTTVAASIGTPSAPGAGIVILSTVLTGVGVPIEGIGLIIGVDHLLGMCRTTVNVAGDLTACVVFGRPEEKSETRDSVAP